ncbi:kinase-like domain-containing protein [Mrakia frigida]|uniref:serine/threonine-protein kinase n=1 Tax=Mrakia frigida TaxID=29902 RepID=UPI003FCBFACF
MSVVESGPSSSWLPPPPPPPSNHHQLESTPSSSHPPPTVPLPPPPSHHQQQQQQRRHPSYPSSSSSSNPHQHPHSSSLNGSTSTSTTKGNGSSIPASSSSWGVLPPGARQGSATEQDSPFPALPASCFEDSTSSITFSPPSTRLHGMEPPSVPSHLAVSPLDWHAPRSYTPVKLVGDGSFGTVWLCDWHSPLPAGTTLSPMQCGAGARPEWVGKRLVAVKRMKRVWERGWEEAGKLKELESLRSIPSHPNIIPLYDAFLQPTKELYFVFECMEGNLYQLTKSRKGRPLAGGLIASVFHQVISGLDHIHASGYFHRDMKPENLLVTTIGLQDYLPVRETPIPPGTRMETDVVVIVKLADFGLAREINSKPPYTEYVSTRWYRAPEVLLRSRDYGPPVDMWALGTILAELVNLKPIFPGQSEVDQVYKICAILGDPSREYGLDERGKPRGGGDWDRGIKMARAVGFGFPKMSPPPFASLFQPSIPLTLIDCISECLRYNPKHRITAKACLEHAYFRITVPRIQATPYIPAMPEAPSPSSFPGRPSQPHLSSSSSNSVLISPPNSGVVHGVPERDLPPSHSSIPHQNPPSFNIVDGSTRTLPPPQLSPLLAQNQNQTRAPFYPQYRDSPSQIPSSPSGGSGISIHSQNSQKTVYDTPGLEHNISSASTLISPRIRTSGASALVDQLRELDLPAADLSSYGRRAPPSGISRYNFKEDQPSSASPTSNSWQQQHSSQASHGSSNSHLSQNHYDGSNYEGYDGRSHSSISPAFAQSSSTVNSGSHASSSSHIDTPGNGSHYRQHPPPTIRTPYDDELSMPPPMDDERVRRQDVVMANAQVEAAKRAALPVPKKKKWGLGSVFGGSNESKHESLAPVGEEPNGSSHSLPLKRTQSISNAPDSGPSPSVSNDPLDVKAAQKEAKRVAKQLELAKREAAQAQARERARAVMQKRDRLVAEQVSTNKANGGGVVEIEWRDMTTGRSMLATDHRSPQKDKGKQVDRQQSAASSSSRDRLGAPSSSSLNHSASNPHLGGSSASHRSGASGGPFKPFDPTREHRHKSRRRDGDDDHSMSSLDANSLRSPSIMTFQSVDSDPGPRSSPRQYPSSLSRTAASVSSQGSTSSPQLYSLPHGSGSIGDQLSRDFREHTNLGSPSGRYASPSSKYDPYGRPVVQASNLSLPGMSSQGLSLDGYNEMFRVPNPPNANSSHTTLPPFSHIASVADQHQQHQSRHPSH